MAVSYFKTLWSVSFLLACRVGTVFLVFVFGHWSGEETEKEVALVTNLRQNHRMLQYFQIRGGLKWRYFSEVLEALDSHFFRLNLASCSSVIGSRIRPESVLLCEIEVLSAQWEWLLSMTPDLKHSTERILPNFNILVVFINTSTVTPKIHRLQTQEGGTNILISWWREYHSVHGCAMINSLSCKQIYYVIKQISVSLCGLGLPVRHVLSEMRRRWPGPQAAKTQL